MNNTLRNTLIVLAILVLAGAVFFAGGAVARSSNFGFWNMMGGRGNNYDPGDMMNGQNNNTGPGDNMMNGQGNNAGPGGMMGGNNNVNLVPLTIDQAKVAAEAYIKNLGVDGLMVDEIMIFDNNAYALVKETDTGLGAFELLIDSGSQYAYPEHGPNIMWNQKYGGLNHQNMMGGQGGMMGVNGWNTTVPADVSADMTVTPEEAIQNAQKYLDANLAGATAAADPIKFYGYYTLDFEKDGKVVGMLSVNGYSGEIFLHTWHGAFIEESSMQ